MSQQEPWRVSDDWIDPGQARTYQEWVQANQAMECKFCGGRGYVFTEDVQGMPSTQVECPYCHGWRHNGWVAERRSKRFDVWDRRRNWLIGLTIFLWATGNAWPGGDYSSAGALLVVIHIGLWLALLGGWVAWLVNRRPKEEKPNQGPPKHAPGFNDQREANALGLYGAALGIRGLLGEWFGKKR